MGTESADDIEFVIGKLAGYRKQDAVIGALCMMNGWNWQRAADFVGRVEAEHWPDILALRRRRWIPVGIVLWIGGAAWIAVSALTWARGHEAPVLVTILIFEFLLPFGGQMAGILLGAALMLAGSWCVLGSHGRQ